MGVARWGFLAIIGFGVSSFAFGQQSQTLRDRDPDIAAAKGIAAEVQQAGFHFGSFYFHSRLRLGDAGFSSQFSLPTGERNGGFRLAVEAPQNLYYVPHRKVIFSAELIPSYAFLTDGGQFDYSARADVHFLFNHLYLDTYVILTDRIRAHVADINRLATVRSDETGVGGEWKHSSRTSTVFAVRRGTSRYPQDRFQPEDRPVELLDRDELTGRVAIHHKTFPLTSLFVATEMGKYEFTRTAFKDSSRRSLSGGFVYDSGRLQLRGEAGTTSLTFDDPAQLDFDGLTGAFSASRSLGRWSVGLGATRDIGFSVMSSNNYFEATTALASVSRTIGRRLSVRANAMRERDDYPVPVLTGLKRQDDISFYSAGFTLGVWKFDIGSDVGWYERTTTFGGDEDSGIRWLLHLSFTL